MTEWGTSGHDRRREAGWRGRGPGSRTLTPPVLGVGSAWSLEVVRQGLQVGKRGREGDGFGKVSVSGISAFWFLLISLPDGRRGEGRNSLCPTPVQP